MWTLQTDVHNYFVSHHFSPAEFAIYAIGCFQLPLIGMLGESVAAVLIPRVSSLQATGDRAEIIRLTIRAMTGGRDESATGERVDGLQCAAADGTATGRDSEADGQARDEGTADQGERGPVRVH